MRNVLVAISILAGCATHVAAQVYMTRTGKISFDATTPSSPEKIAGVNNDVANVVDAKTGDVVFQVLVKSFKFQRELMQEHFNENYMESDKYPKSEFKGKITNISEVSFSKDGVYNAKVAGKLTIHGITHEVDIPGSITVKGNTATLKTKFAVRFKDYNINIPSVVSDKVAKEAAITLESNLIQK